ncbi:hypothetical protein [Sporolactobacillus terrae]|uniref:Uncharacterized protein n=1 Tax=Sporolactobacillus terrae TaxID=269673 RepID=A0A410D7C2_9BACL|nr:hypothetical protein [Sporolactobacillus terrae]QAA22014.1 hypothetical protein C0674_04950 [Sporolactobacillus terrae]QAA24987.1 hypothetical protein C0679_04925 [Sporolactobacillus terrae]UAK16811.1 hypothetical protein K7399_02295 [Sporolactobacillus terrae]BBN98300.1 hypothetical protein St703_10050 [Sporolactobacillus terrae]
MKNWNASEAMIEENNRALVALRKYEEEHRYSFADRHVYWAVTNEIERLEKQNVWLAERS